MTRNEIAACKRFAKDGLAQAGINLNINRMGLLECSSHKATRTSIDAILEGEIMGRAIFYRDELYGISYVMVEDITSGIQYQITYGAENISETNPSLYAVGTYAEA